MTTSAKWVVYIIQSSVNAKLYTGVTNNIIRRVRMHNAGKGAKATRPGRPWRIVYVQIMPSKSDALKREAAIKRLKRDDKLRLVKAFGGKGPEELPPEEVQGA